MAEAKLSDKDTEKSLECSICFFDFEEPKQLPCLHTFCLKCLKKYCERDIVDGRKPCPLCRKEFCIPQGDVQNFANNQFMMRLILTKKAREEEKKPAKCDLCAEVGESGNAISFCKECKQCLCARCQKYHSVATASKFHKVVDIKEKPSEEILLKMKSSFCSTHPSEELKLYCCDCKELICYICHVNDHGKHNCKLIQDFSKQRKEALAKHEGSIKKFCEDGRVQLKQLQQERDKTAAEVSTAAKSIEETFERIERTIAERKAHLLQELEATKGKRFKEIDTQEDLAQLNVTELSSFITYSRMVMERGTDCEIIRVADELHKRAEELIKSQDERNKQQLPDFCIAFMPTPAPTEVDVERFTGCITNLYTDNTRNLSSSTSPLTVSSLLPIISESSILSRLGSNASQNCPVNQSLNSTTNLPRNSTSNQSLTSASTPPLSNTSNSPLKSSSSSSENFASTSPLNCAPNFRPRRNSIKILELDEEITGLTVLNDENMYVITRREKHISVFDSYTGKAKPHIKVPELKNPAGIAGCSHNKALYISDWDLASIHQISLSDSNITRWEVGENNNHKPCGLSVTSENNVLVTVQITGAVLKSRIIEYSSDGQVIKDIKLPNSIVWAWHTVKHPSGQLIICHGWDNSSLHRLCVIDSEGQIIKSYGRERGKGKNQLYVPRSLAIDTTRNRVLVADYDNNRVTVLSNEMTFLGYLQLRKDLSGPWCLCFDSSSNRLLVGERDEDRVHIVWKPQLESRPY